MDWTGLEGKRVFIRTLHGKVYSGVIKSVIPDGQFSYSIHLIDKFGKSVILARQEIGELKEE